MELARLCIYCSKPANSNEHIIATRFIEVLEQATARPITGGMFDDGKNQTPITVSLNDRGKRQFNFTTELICRKCNNEWMDVIDDRAFRYMGRLFRGQEIRINSKMRKEVAAWAVKTAITTRFAHVNPTPVEGEWPKQLMEDKKASQEWTVWLGRFVGTTDFWFRQGGLDVTSAVRAYPSVLDRPPSAPPLSQDGVVLTMVIGQLWVQVIRLNGPGNATTHATPETIQIWPTGPTETWPPSASIDDSTLEAYANRFYSGAPLIMQVPREAATDQPLGPQPAVFISSPITEDGLDQPAAFTFNHTCGVCNTNFGVPYDTGKRLRELALPFKATYTFVCPECGETGTSEFELQQPTH